MGLITITANIGCDGLEIARKVAEELSIDLYDDDRLRQEALKMGVKAEEMKGFEEKAPGYWERFFSQKPESYVDVMESVIYAVAQRGQGVIVGHGASFLLRDFGCALHARVYASDDFRVESLMESHGMEDEAAYKMIMKSDRERGGFMDYAFQIDWNDPSFYDLMINRDKVGVKTAAKMIAKAAVSDEINSCSLTAVEAMENLSLQKKVEAAILRANFSKTELHVEVPEPGVVEIMGWLRQSEEKDNLLKVVKAVSGVKSVHESFVVVPNMAE